MFDVRHRVAGSAALAVGVVASAGLSSLAGDDRDGYILAHSLASAPFLIGALVCAGHVVDRGPRQYRTFWRRWFSATLLGSAATLAAIGSVVLQSDALMVVDMALLVAAVPFWTSAGIQMLRLQAGRRDATVDMVDASMALVVLSAPGVLFLGEAIADSTDLVFAGPFALFLVLTPAGIYGALLNLARVPTGERVTQGLGVVLAATFSLSVAFQLAHVAGGLELPLAVFVGLHAANLAVVAALPLWAHRVTSGGLGRLPVERQMRRANPMPTISAAVLPVLALYVLTLRADDRWAVAYLAVVLLAVVVLNALRHAMLSREANHLSGELASMAEERRQLLASMVRALDDDRRRTVAELHTQAVGSLSTLGTVVQTACVSLPPTTATVVRETIAQLQGDLSNRAEELRMLMVAMRPASFGEPSAAGRRAAGTRGAPGGDASAADGERAGTGAEAAPARSDDALSAALRAYASDLCAERTAATHPAVHIEVDPRLELDRSTMTIVYRVTQEALLNAVRHAEAERVTVAVSADGHIGGAIAVEVADDGIGFDTTTTAEGSGLASIRLFTDLGRGEVSLRSAPGEGTVVRSLLGVHDSRARSFASASASAGSPGGDAGPGVGRDDVASSPGRPGRRHLRLIPPADVSPRPT
ncbi:MAG: hypothetical protein PV358_00955 [Acidimicrobiales bacterium]|nr:hypothetical protein [Acidimicrobiales bacterium]